MSGSAIKAMELVEKVVEADEGQRCEEASALYKDATDNSQHSHGEQTKSIQTKCIQRAEQLGAASRGGNDEEDTTKEQEPDGSGGKDSSKADSEKKLHHLPAAGLVLKSTMERAIDQVLKATEADNAARYEEALPLYEHAIDYFLHVLKYEAHGERSKESILAKCGQYLERTEQLKKFLAKRKALSGAPSGVLAHQAGPNATKEQEPDGSGGKDSSEADSEKKLHHLPAAGGLVLKSTMERAIDQVLKATEADNAARYKEALPLYEHAIDYFLHALKYEAHGERSKESIRAKCGMYLERAEQLKKLLAKRNEARYEKKLCAQLSAAIIGEKPEIQWDTIAGLQTAKEALKEAASAIGPSHLSTKKTKPCRAILLYGPSGTGKSCLAKAVATEVESTLFSISSSDLVSKWVGESVRLVKKLFELARAQNPAIIFIDEVDSLCSGLQSVPAMSNIRAEFLTQIRKVQVGNDRILILGTTSVPWSINAEAWSCFQKKIYIPLPNEPARRCIFANNVGNTRTDITEQQYQELAWRTEGYSGADIGIVVKEALMMPIRKIQTATHFKKVTGPSPNDPSVTVDDLWMPCGPCVPGAVEMKWSDVPKYRLQEPPVVLKDFERALRNTPPTVKPADVKRFDEFICSLGEEM